MSVSNAETYFRDHWVEVDPGRIEAYEAAFTWRPEMAPLLEPADLKPGQTVVDYGCGPGGLAVELARRVGGEGHVHGVDLNAEFIERARERAKEEGVNKTCTFHHASDDRIPLDDDSVDRLVCKNVMEYVPDVAATIAEFKRVTKPGGLVHIIDSDWGMLVVEPIGPARMARLFEAAKPAYKTPLIGRGLYGAMKAAGLKDVKVRVITSADTKGYAAFVIANMANYAREFGKMPDEEIDAIVNDLKESIEMETYLMILPQFLVTGTA